MQQLSSNQMDDSFSNYDYTQQNQLLPGVSRTFALTIPQLPYRLCPVITNAYLLCRIADTIEDDALLSVVEKTNFEKQFVEVVKGNLEALDFVNQLLPALSLSTPQKERELIEKIPLVIRCLESFNPNQQKSLRRCVEIMSTGMARFQRNASPLGLTDLQEVNHYCYYVAGVVGEMLTEVFCDFSPKIQKNYQQLMPLAISFGQGLQMTNVLKDLWEDRTRGICWYPRENFQKHGIDLSALETQHRLVGFETGLKELIAITLGHLENALQYVALIPYEEDGIRRFCSWAISLAVLTLKKINHNPKFESGKEVKISRRQVKAAILSTNFVSNHNFLLKCLFKTVTIGMARDYQSTTNLFTEWFTYE